ncbi:MAG: hypothetical protein IBX60_06840 [Candidatus Aminicenantes bacterium]|nr:hypothetical protein [Candidatus Aminicenantes bacterium]
MTDWLFAFFHLFLLIGIIGYAVFSLFQGNVFRFVLILLCLVGYYFLILQKSVKKEIKRKRKK